jgi:hypothetical protein
MQINLTPAINFGLTRSKATQNLEALKKAAVKNTAIASALRVYDRGGYASESSTHHLFYATTLSIIGPGSKRPLLIAETVELPLGKGSGKFTVPMTAYKKGTQA